jgi:hypothetical protein
MVDHGSCKSQYFVWPFWSPYLHKRHLSSTSFVYPICLVENSLVKLYDDQLMFLELLMEFHMVNEYFAWNAKLDEHHV